MYVCNCNGIRERQVRAAIEAGATKPAQIFAANQCQAQCARCVCEMRQMIDESRQALAYDAGHGPSLNMLGILAMSAGQLDQAANFFARAASAFKVQHLGNEAGLPSHADVTRMRTLYEGAI